MTDGRTKVRKDTKGYLMMSNPDTPWHVLLGRMLNEHGTAAALARSLNLERQAVREWIRTEEKAGRMRVIAQPPYRYEVVEIEHEA